MVYRESDNRDFFNYYVYYRFATEIATSRPGSYYGSAIVLQNHYASGSAIFDALVDLADIVKANCLTEEAKFHRDIKSLKFAYPDSVTRLTSLLKKNFYSVPYKPNKGAFLPIGNGHDFRNYEHFINNVAENKYLEDFQSSYASSSVLVADYVREKRGLEIVSLSVLRENKRKEDEARRLDEINARKANHSHVIQVAQSKKASSRDSYTSVENIVLRLTKLESRIENLENQRRFLQGAKYTHNVTKGRLSRSLSRFLYPKRLLVFLLIFVVIAILAVLLLFFYHNIFGSPQAEASSDETRHSSIGQRSQTDPYKWFEYVGDNDRIRTVGDLSELVLNKCKNQCTTNRKELLQSIGRINSVGKSIEKKGLVTSVETLSHFPLSEITPPIRVQLSDCCDLSGLVEFRRAAGPKS
jgi:hypothetical protein